MTIEAAQLRDVERAIVARAPETSIEPSLDRIADIVDLLGHPERAYPVVHVAGTNGKTSTARMIDTLLRARGLRTGRYTSPHLASMTERICLDGRPLDAERFVAAYTEVLPYVEMVDARHPVRMSFFEVLTAMAFAAFADAPVDVAVIEVGLGGSWDATNVADGAVAVVTPISLDHTHLLGDTVEVIAEEKAGIIKPGSIAVIGRQQVPAAEVLMRRVAEVSATVAREGLEFGVLHREIAVGGQQLTLQGLHGGYDEVYLPLFGEHQAANAACALAAVEAFATPGTGADDRLDAELVRQAFAGVDSPGRMEVVRTSPTVLIDAAHNPGGMEATMQAVQESFTFTRLVGVFAAMADKDVAGLLDELEPVLAEVVVTRNSSPRSMPPDDLAALAASVFGAERVHAAATLDVAIDTAVALAEQDYEMSGVGVLITGSVITAGEARTLLGGDR